MLVKLYCLGLRRGWPDYLGYGTTERLGRKEGAAGAGHLGILRLLLLV